MSKVAIVVLRGYRDSWGAGACRETTGNGQGVQGWS
jgi:hypothetical protein